jgi:uncharacterized protein (DUF934 family)
MSVIVRDDGFHPDDWHGAVEEVAADTPEARLAALAAGNAMLRVHFAAFNDGRGFTLARRLRALGFGGRLRAAGPLLPDHYAMARRSGFDEVESPPEIAARLPVQHWLARANWRENDYQRRLRG